jgi:hypothetical protein
MKTFYKKNKRKICLLEKIDENEIFIEINSEKYNNYNQISIIEKIMKVYMNIVKCIIKFRH